MWQKSLDNPSRWQEVGGNGHAALAMLGFRKIGIILDFKLENVEYTSIKPFIIAEVGVNHEGSLERALEHIRAAASAGADAVKFQTYRAETLAARTTSSSYWDTGAESETSQFALFSRYDKFGPEDYLRLSEECSRQNVVFMSTPFDIESVDFLSYQKVIKIASADLTNVPLRRRIASLGKPVLLSTGASSVGEVETAVSDIFSHGAPQLSLLHCVLNYPSTAGNANLKRIDSLLQKFGQRCSIGYSDHVALKGLLPFQILVALELGASVIEKHFTLDKSLPGNDHYHAMDESDLRSMKEAILARAELLSLDGSDYLETQRAARNSARRRIFTSRTIRKGDALQVNDLIPLRSDIGLEIHKWDSVIGKKAIKDIGPLEPIMVDDISND